MRVRTFWTIENHHVEKVFYGMYKPDDTLYAKTGGGHEGWLESGKSMDMEVDFPKCKIVFWKDKPFLGGLAEKVAAPKLVTTDRPVTLTKQKKVVQPDEAEFSDPDHIGPVVFMTSMEINNAVRGLVLAGLGKIPQVGGAIAAILGFLWSEQKVDLIAESEQRMKRWVQGRFEDYDREFLQATLSGLRANLKEYQNATSQGERARWFDVSLASCQRALPFFTERQFTPGTSALAVALGTTHLTLLRERVLFPEEIFGDEAVNLASFKKELKGKITVYQKYIHEVAVPGELKWRQEMISTTVMGGGAAADGPLFLSDSVTREVHRFRYSAQGSAPQNQTVCEKYYREQAKGSFERQLHENVVHTALFWTLLDPEQQGAHPIPLDGVTWNAALAGLGYMYGNTHRHDYNDASLKRIGRITEIVYWESGNILGLQFKGTEGTAGHEGTTGKRHTLKVPADTFLTCIETWFGFDLFGIKFHFSDGTIQGPYGTPSRGDVHQRAEFPHHHVSAIGVGKRMQELRCGFTPLPDYYERLIGG